MPKHGADHRSVGDTSVPDCSQPPHYPQVQLGCHVVVYMAVVCILLRSMMLWWVVGLDMQQTVLKPTKISTARCRMGHYFQWTQGSRTQGHKLAPDSPLGYSWRHCSTHSRYQSWLCHCQPVCERFRRHVVVSSDSGNGDSDSQLQASEEMAVMVSVEVPVIWSNLSSSDESAVDFCGLNSWCVDIQTTTYSVVIVFTNNWL